MQKKENNVLVKLCYEYYQNIKTYIKLKGYSKDEELSMLEEYIKHYLEGKIPFIGEHPDRKYTEEELKLIKAEFSKIDSYFEFMLLDKDDPETKRNIPEILSEILQLERASLNSSKEEIHQLLKHPYIAKICKTKKIDVEKLFETNFDSLCEELKDIWKVGINPDEIIDGCESKGKKDLTIYFDSKVNLVYRLILKVKKDKNAQSLNEVLSSDEMINLFSKTGITEKEIDAAINRISVEIVHHRASNPFMDSIFNEFKLIEIMSKKPIYDFFVTEEIEKKGLQNENFQFYENAKKMKELVMLIEQHQKRKEKISRIEALLTDEEYFMGKNEKPKKCH